MNTQATAESLVGQVLNGAYRIDRLVGRGGMGNVYEAFQLSLKTRVALKVMSRELAANRDALARFRQEAEVTSALGHPHIVRLRDFGMAATGESFLVMELLEGEDLDQRLRRVGRLSAVDTLHVIKQIAAALAVTHAKGIVHRDLKPANVFLQATAGRTDYVKVLDFGISKVRSARTRLSQSAAFMGTPQYMAPEQALGQLEQIDGRTDQWALACIAWEALSGCTPFIGENVLSLLFQVVYEEPPALALASTEICPGLEAVLRRALSKRREERFDSILAFVRALERAVKGGEPLDEVSSQGSDGSQAEESIQSTSVPAEVAPAPVHPWSSHRQERLLALASTAVLVGATAIASFLFGDKPRSEWSAAEPSPARVQPMRERATDRAWPAAPVPPKLDIPRALGTDPPAEPRGLRSRFGKSSVIERRKGTVRTRPDSAPSPIASYGGKPVAARIRTLGRGRRLA